MSNPPVGDELRYVLERLGGEAVERPLDVLEAELAAAELAALLFGDVGDSAERGETSEDEPPVEWEEGEA